MSKRPISFSVFSDKDIAGIVNILISITLILKLVAIIISLCLAFSCQRLNHVAGDRLINKRSISITLDSANFYVEDLRKDEESDVLFSYYELLGLKKETFAVDSLQTTRLFVKSPIYLGSNREGSRYVLYPGDDIQIHTSPSGNFSLSSKTDKTRTADFRLRVLFKQKLFDSAYSYTQYKPSAPVLNDPFYNRFRSELGLSLRSATSRRIRLLDSLSGEKQKHSRAKTELRSEITADSLLKMLTTLWYYNSYDSSSNLRLLAIDVVNSVSTVIKSDDERMLYYDMINQSLHELLLISDLNRAMVSDSILSKIYGTVERLYTGFPKEYLLARCISIAMANRIPQAEYFLSRYERSSEDVPYKATLRQLYNLYNPKYTKARSQVSTPFMEEPVRSINGRSDIDFYSVLTQAESELVLIDVWASWCIPCRQNISYTKSLGQQYPKKDLSVIFLSIDKDILAWKRASLSHSLDAKRSLYLRNGNNSTFMKKFGIESIPHYMLFRRGKLVADTMVPEAGNKEFHQFVDSLLKAD